MIGWSFSEASRVMVHCPKDVREVDCSCRWPGASSGLLWWNRVKVYWFMAGYGEAEGQKAGGNHWNNDVREMNIHFGLTSREFKQSRRLVGDIFHKYIHKRPEFLFSDLYCAKQLSHAKGNGYIAWRYLLRMFEDNSNVRLVVAVSAATRLKFNIAS